MSDLQVPKLPSYRRLNLLHNCIAKVIPLAWVVDFTRLETVSNTMISKALSRDAEVTFFPSRKQKEVNTLNSLYSFNKGIVMSVIVSY